MNKRYVENIPMLAQRFAEIFVKFRIRLRGKACNEHACIVVPALRASGSLRERGAFEVGREWRMVRRTRVYGTEQFRSLRNAVRIRFKVFFNLLNVKMISRYGICEVV